MNVSTEELIELLDFKSPLKEKTRKSNRVDLSPSITTVNTISETEDANIVNIFSVTPRTYSKRPSSADRRTISEISDDVFLVKPETRPSSSKRDVRKSYKEKLSEHIRKIKERTATTSTDLGKGRIPVDRIRKESQSIDAEIENVRSKFSRERENNRVNNGFFDFVQEPREDEKVSGVSEATTYYSLPEKMDFNAYLAEKECFFNTRKFKPVEENKKIGFVESTSVNVPKLTQFNRNILEQRFTAIDDKRWFDNEGNLLLLENPVTPFSLRPSGSFETGINLIEYFPPNLNNQELEEVLVEKESILNLYLSHLKFLHHPLFSIENIFAEILTTAYGDYEVMEQKNVINKLKCELDELRGKISTVEDSHVFSKLDREIRKIRTKYYSESKRRRGLTFTILEAWKTVKKIRQIQNYSNTTVKLLIKKEKVDIDNENKEQKEMYDMTLEEIKRQSVSSKGINSARSNSKNDNSVEQKSSQDKDSDEDNNSGGSKYVSKTDTNFEHKLELELSRIFRESFKTPGDPNLKFALRFNNPITENLENNRETARRAAVSSTKFYLRLLCNNIEACKTKFLNLTDDFVLDIDETFSLQLTDIPTFLTIEVYAQPKSLLKKKVCEISINVPSLKSCGKTVKNTFEKNEIVHYKHEGVGSGIDLQTVVEKMNLTLKNIENCELKTSGYLEYFVEWETMDTKEIDNSLYVKMKKLDEVMDKNFVVNYEKVKELLHIPTTLNDEHTESDNEQRNLKKNFFRLSPDQNSLVFCNITEIEQNIRLKILQLRDQKEIEFDGMLVPNRLKEIPFNILANYTRRKATEDKGNLSDDDDEAEYKTQYNFGKKYLKQVHIKVFQLCKNTENNLDYESIVNEKYFVYFHFMMKTLLRNFFNWFRWRPKVSKPLPILQKTDSEEAHQITKTNLNVNINIVSGKNLPNRKKRTFNEDVVSDNVICPYVEVSYKNIFARTSTSKGKNASWNEVLTIPLESTHLDYLNPNSLEGVISVDVFDESGIEVKKLNKKCTNWLGGIDILLSAICCSDSMNGNFQLKIPHVLLDYEREGETSNSKSPKLSNSQTVRTFLSMEISIEPNVPKLTPNMEELPSSDIPYIQEHVLKWNRTYNSSYPHRKFNALVLDTNGKTTCVTRYIKALEPPQINTEEFDVAVEQCSRYISLVPFTECNHFYTNIWLSADQLINFMLGSITDHAIALTCYLLALNVEAWLLLGYGIPHGNTAYVLIRDHSGDAPLSIHYVIDVVYNEKYNLLDENCPLKRIFCVINGTNVWANTQKTDNIALTRVEFHRSSDWLPLFDNNVSAPNSFMANKITYKIREDTEMVEVLLEKYLKRKISKVRQLDRTIWNSGLSSVLVNALKTFEMNCMYNKNHNETILELNQEISQYTVSGFALNTPLKSLSELVKKIKRIGLHIQQEKEIEFALAVYVHSYPGRLFSIWIFLVSIKNNI